MFLRFQSQVKKLVCRVHHPLMLATPLNVYVKL